MIKIDCGHGFTAVPYRDVTLNGIYLGGEPTLGAEEEYTGDWAVLMPPNNRAAMDENGARPFRYRSLEAAKQDVEVLCKFHLLGPDGKPTAPPEVVNAYFNRIFHRTPPMPEILDRDQEWDMLEWCAHNYPAVKWFRDYHPMVRESMAKALKQEQSDNV